jgi:hypothetical protein
MMTTRTTIPSKVGPTHRGIVGALMQAAALAVEHEDHVSNISRRRVLQGAAAIGCSAVVQMPATSARSAAQSRSSYHASKPMTST